MNLIIAFLALLNGDSNPDLGNASAVLYQLSYQANWEQDLILR